MPTAYTYTSSAKNVRRQNATILQLWFDFSAYRLVDGVNDSWRLLIITIKGKEWPIKGKEWRSLLLMKEFSGFKP